MTQIKADDVGAVYHTREVDGNLAKLAPPPHLPPPPTHLPPTIRVGPFDYKLTRSSIPDGYANFGETDLHNRELRFSPMVDEARMPYTLLHEVLHAVWHHYGLRYVAKDDEERILDALTNGLLQVMHDLGYWPKALRLDGE